MGEVALKLKEGAGVQTPSQAIIAAGNQKAEVIDSRARVLVVKKISPLERMRLFRVAGAELSANQQWIGMAAIAVSVISIDGDAVGAAGTTRQIEALVDMLGDEGLEAAAQAYVEHFGVVVADEVKDAAKN